MSQLLASQGGVSRASAGAQALHFTWMRAQKARESPSSLISAVGAHGQEPPLRHVSSVHGTRQRGAEAFGRAVGEPAPEPEAV